MKRPGKFFVGDNVVSLMKVSDVFIGKEPSKPKPEVRGFKNVFLCDDWVLTTVCLGKTRSIMPSKGKELPPTTLSEFDVQN
jgi:hypothetical protein